MAKYGNVLTVYSPQGNQLNDIITILNAKNAKFEQVDSTFFVETNSVANTKDLETALLATAISFTFFHNRIPTGSRFKTSLTDQPKVNSIIKILKIVA
jgi:hypothetical protein